MARASVRHSDHSYEAVKIVVLANSTVHKTQEGKSVDLELIRVALVQNWKK